MARNANPNASMSAKKLQQWLDYEETEDSLEYLLEEEQDVPQLPHEVGPDLSNEKSVEVESSPIAQEIEMKHVKGRVSSLDEALIGTTILLEGTDIGVVTNFEGEFEIDIAAEGAILLISSDGFETKRIEIGDQLFLDIVLEEKIELSEIVVSDEMTTAEEDDTEIEVKTSTAGDKVRSRGIGKTSSRSPQTPSKLPQTQSPKPSPPPIPVSPEDSEENLAKEIQKSRSVSLSRQKSPPVVVEPITDPTPTPKSIKEKVAEWSEKKGEPGIEHFYKYLAWHPSFVQRLVVIVGSILILVSAYFTIRFFSTPPPVPAVYQRIEGIKRLGELHLVKQHYESIIPILKEPGERSRQDPELQFLLIAPVEVSGYLDFSKIKLDIQKDSLAVMILPEPKISKVYLDFRKTEEFLSDGKLRIFGKQVERLNYEKAYYDIAVGINENKKKVVSQAETNGIKEETILKAEMFLRNFLNSLGYRAEFRKAEKNDSAAKPIKDENEDNSDQNQS